MKKVEIYTDGACSGNPGPGGWAAVLIYKDVKKEISGFIPETTNNQMELYAAIKALEVLKQRCEVIINTDSAYVSNGFILGWVYKWEQKGFVDVKNAKLWKRLLELSRNHIVAFRKVKGHDTCEYNNLCDSLATAEIKKNKI